MSSLREQTAQPQRKYTTHAYPCEISYCPACHNRKSPHALHCLDCHKRLPRPVRRVVTTRAVLRPAIVQPDDPDIRLIALTQNQVTVVDKSRYAEAIALNWYAVKNNTKCGFYAASGSYRPYSKTGQSHITLHQFLMGTETRQVDHIDGNGLNNCMSNLRFANAKENSRNRGLRKDSTSGFIGVSQLRNNDRWILSKKGKTLTRKWKAQICVDGKKMFLGRYKEKETAAIVRDIVTVLHFREFSRLNFPENASKYQAVVDSFKALGLQDLLAYFFQQASRFK